jgi:hypothetical protein
MKQLNDSDTHFFVVIFLYVCEDLSSGGTSHQSKIIQQNIEIEISFDDEIGSKEMLLNDCYFVCD